MNITKQGVVTSALVLYDTYGFLNEKVKKHGEEERSINNGMNVDGNAIYAMEAFEDSFNRGKIDDMTYKGLLQLTNGIMQLKCDTYHQTLLTPPNGMTVDPAVVNPGYTGPSTFDFAKNQALRLFP
jgi:hypothetical protein